LGGKFALGKSGEINMLTRSMILIAAAVALASGSADAASIALVENETTGVTSVAATGFPSVPTVTPLGFNEGVTVTADIPGVPDPSNLAVQTFTSVELCDSLNPCVPSDIASVSIQSVTVQGGPLTSLLTLQFASDGAIGGLFPELETAGPDTLINFQTLVPNPFGGNVYCIGHGSVAARNSSAPFRNPSPRRTTAVRHGHRRSPIRS
jgi:hypothetical protein